MYSKIDIINLALANLSNTNFIQDLDEDNLEAKQAAAHWDIVLECVLGEFPWSFATRVRRLSLLGSMGATPEWQRHYAYPVDCLKIRRLYVASAVSRGVPFKIGMADDGNSRIIMTSCVNVIAEYTSRNVKTPLMPAHFVNAIAWRLAAETALAHKADRNLADSATQAYFIQLEKAKLHDATESGPPRQRRDVWLEARNV